MKFFHSLSLSLASSSALFGTTQASSDRVLKPLISKPQGAPNHRSATPGVDSALHEALDQKLNSFKAEINSHRGERQLHQDPKEVKEIDVYFHVIVANLETGDDVPEEILDVQVQILNEAYGGMTNSFFTDCSGKPSVSYETNFRFRKAAYKTVTNMSVITDVDLETVPDKDMAELFFLTENGKQLQDVPSFMEYLDMTKEEQFQVLNKAPNANNILLDFAMGHRLRQGDCTDLNVYILPGPMMGALGMAQFPWKCHENGVLQKIDGLMIHRATLPGSDFKLPNPNAFTANTPNEELLSYVNEGDTLVHEIGHWLGLYHTFQDSGEVNATGCDVLGGGGDQILDTPAQESMTGCLLHPCCPKERDTCIHLPGLDPVWNFMDYSDDCCMDRFTPMQAERMHYNWRLFREQYAADVSDSVGGGSLVSVEKAAASTNGASLRGHGGERD